MKKAVIYARVAAGGEAGAESLERQMEACREYCGSEGLKPVMAFSDLGASGMTTNRPELGAMLGFCQDDANGVDCVVVLSVDRLSRDLMGWIEIERVLMASCVAIRVVRRPRESVPDFRRTMGAMLKKA